MDTSQQATGTSRDKAASVMVVQRRQQLSVAEKRRMVEETLVPGALSKVLPDSSSPLDITMCHQILAMTRSTMHLSQS